jgi:hypothetical protein
MSFVLPERCSLRRAVALTGLSRTRIIPLFADDERGRRSIPMAALDKLHGPRLTEDATLEIAGEQP